MLTDRANLMLDAWDEQLVSADEVRTWAESELMAIADAASVPGWLLDLLQHGPDRFADASHSWRTRASYKIRFAMHATRVDLVDRASVERFARWVAGAAMGEDLSKPEVVLGYQVDHYLDDHGDLALAIRCVRECLPPLLADCRTTIATVLG